MFLFVYNVSLFTIDVVQLAWRSFVATVLAIFHLIIKPSKKPLDGEIVLITGSAHGLGKELALEFSRRGAYLVLWDINKDGLDEMANEIKKLHGKAKCYCCDVADRDAVKQTALQVWDEVGNVTILINNAGIIPVKPFASLNHQQIRRTIEVNTMAHFWTISEFLPRMIDMSHGHIVSISSLAGKIVTANLVPYCASKFAATGLMESLSEEMRYYHKSADVYFTTVFPFVLNTGFCKDLRIKYPWLSPPTNPDVAACKIVDAVQRNEEYVYIPGYFEFAIRFIPILPRKVQLLIADFFDTGLNPQDD